jgi:hypothetical protein
MEHILFYFVYRKIPSRCEIEFSWFIQAFNLFEFMFYKQKQIKRLLDDKYSCFPWRQFFILYSRTISWFASINALIFKHVYVQENFKIFIELIIRKSSFHAHWLFSIILCWFYDILPSCFPMLFMTLWISRQNIEYQIYWKIKKTIAENNKKRQSQGTLHAVPITRNYTKIPVTGKNTKK